MTAVAFANHNQVELGSVIRNLASSEDRHSVLNSIDIAGLGTETEIAAGAELIGATMPDVLLEMAAVSTPQLEECLRRGGTPEEIRECLRNPPE